jgi:hypothetical protein
LAPGSVSGDYYRDGFTSVDTEPLEYPSRGLTLHEIQGTPGSTVFRLILRGKEILQCVCDPADLPPCTCATRLANDRYPGPTPSPLYGITIRALAGAVEVDSSPVFNQAVTDPIRDNWHSQAATITITPRNGGGGDEGDVGATANSPSLPPGTSLTTPVRPLSDPAYSFLEGRTRAPEWGQRVLYVDLIDNREIPEANKLKFDIALEVNDVDNWTILVRNVPINAPPDRVADISGTGPDDLLPGIPGASWVPIDVGDYKSPTFVASSLNVNSQMVALNIASVVRISDTRARVFLAEETDFVPTAAFDDFNTVFFIRIDNDALVGSSPTGAPQYARVEIEPFTPITFATSRGPPQPRAQ